ncbi:hypothetical protein [Cupriavidus sp. CP313]
MPWQYTDFQREKLYEQVWAEPVTRVAKCYAISDVGLRKICRALDVPIPPAGYWAKVAAGKAVERPRLEPTDGATSYRRSQYVDEELDARYQERLEQDLPHRAKPATVPLRTSLDDCLPLARRVAQRLQGKGKDTEAWRACDGPGLMAASTSSVNSLRAVLLLNLVLESMLAAGYALSSHGKGKSRASVSILQLDLSFRIRERARRETLPLSPEQERQNAEAGFNLYRPQYKQHPTGDFDIAATEVDGYRELARIGDSAASRVETRVAAFVERLRELAVRHQVKAELAAERQALAAVQAAELRRQAEVRQLAQARLKTVEEWSAQLERANRLRALADVFESKHLAAWDGAVDGNWIRRAADWLDPTVAGRWEEVDGPFDSGANHVD